MSKARLYFDGDNSGIEKNERTYGLTQNVEDKLDSIPGVVDNTSSTSTTDALSANMGRDLQEQINNLAARGRYLSTRNAVTGLPDTNPQVDPYLYRAGDYYIVSTVGGTNLRPSGDRYTVNVASQVIEPQTLSVNDLYIYDGSIWILQQSGSSLYAVWGSITGTLSAQTDLQNALDSKAAAADVNTKTFTLTGTTGQTNLDTAQAAYDYWKNGGNPIIMYQNKSYTLYAMNTYTGHLQFTIPDMYNRVSANKVTFLGDDILQFSVSSDSVTGISTTYQVCARVLTTDTDYSSPYQPLYPGSPATKKYVDEAVTFKPFPNTFSTTGTTAQFLSSISALDLPVGSAYLGQVSLSDMPAGVSLQAEVEVYVYPSNGAAKIIYAVMRSADVPPYLWSVNSYTYSSVQAWTPEANFYTGSSAPTSSATEGMLWYDTTNDVLKTYDGTNWHEVGVSYIAGEGISIGSVDTRKGPCPDGFHVPSIDEWTSLKTILTGLSVATGQDCITYLHMPFAGYRATDGSTQRQQSYGHYWTSTPYGSSYPEYALCPELSSNYIDIEVGRARAEGASIRPFKNGYVTPTSSGWTALVGTLGNAGIFYNSTDGLISITGDGSTGHTITDKNLGATSVYNDGDTLSEANCGKYYQWGNNYGFPRTGTITNTSSTQVDASSYGPDNPYLSDTFIISNTDWSSVQNDNLRGGVTGIVDNVITNTGVLSTGPTTITGIWAGTEAEYGQINNPSANILYFTF